MSQSCLTYMIKKETSPKECLFLPVSWRTQTGVLNHLLQKILTIGNILVRIGARIERSDKRGIFTTILIYTHIMEKTTLHKGLFAVCIGWICCRSFVVLPDIYAVF